MRGPNRARMTEGTLVEGESEEVSEIGGGVYLLVENAN